MSRHWLLCCAWRSTCLLKAGNIDNRQRGAPHRPNRGQMLRAPATESASKGTIGRCFSMTFSLSRRQILAGTAATAIIRPGRVLSDTRPRPNPRRAKSTPNNIVGPRLIVGFLGQDPIDDGVQAIARDIEEERIAGVILLRRNISSIEQLAGLCAFLRSSAKQVPPLICIDHEGGAVARASPDAGFSTWLPADIVGVRYRTAKESSEYYRSRASELAFSGINMNFGPVVDINVNPDNPIIGRLGRSFSDDPTNVTTAAEGFIQAHRDAGILTCLKHFPGHGSSQKDSHKGFVDVSRSWSDIELQPYRDLVAKGLVDTVMNSHLFHPRFSDGDGIPASLSVKSVQAIRSDVGFGGVIVSDDMQMGAVTNHFKEISAALSAIRAGNDLLVYSTFDRPDQELGMRINQFLNQSVRDGDLSRQESERSSERIFTLRRALSS